MAQKDFMKLILEVMENYCKLKPLDGFVVDYAENVYKLFGLYIKAVGIQETEAPEVANEKLEKILQEMQEIVE